VHIHSLELERVERMLSFERSSPLERPETREFFVRNGFPIERFTTDGLKPQWMGTGLYDPARKPDVLITDGEVIRVGRREFEVIWTPGHSPGHCVIYMRSEKVLIVGDHLLPKITPHVGLLPGGPPNPLGDFIASQGKVKLPEVELVLPAHGAVYRNHRRRADELIEHHMSREAAILDVIARGPYTAFSVASEVFGGEERPIFHVIAATFETLAHLEYSRECGRALRIERDGCVFYQAAS
jgi:glyoxylase-like metal-dependent hydrolase (beta-lactamase superfamily II)